MIDGQLSEKFSARTQQGYVLGVKIFEHGLWLECHGLLLISNRKQEVIISRLSFMSASYQEILQAARAWASAYGREFVDLTISEINEHFKTIPDYVTTFKKPSNPSGSVN